MESDDDGSSLYHFGKLPRRIYVSRTFPNRPDTPNRRYVSQVTDQPESLAFATIKDEIVLQSTPSGRIEVRATVVEDDRRVTQLVIQKFDSESEPSKRQYFNLQRPAIDRLLGLLESIQSMPLEHGDKFHLTANEVSNAVLNPESAKRLFGINERLFVEIARNSDLQTDLVALGYRRRALATFERMLEDSAFFTSEESRTGLQGEKLWQQFFEQNKWIFGYGLAYQFLGTLDEGKLERTIVGGDLATRAKRPDGVMKTQARINSLCFVEIKRHDRDLLLPSAYRGDAWVPNKDLSGGVAQLQTAVQAAIERYTPKLELIDDDGNPSHDPIFTIDPRAFLVIGNLGSSSQMAGSMRASFALLRPLDATFADPKSSPLMSYSTEHGSSLNMILRPSRQTRTTSTTTYHSEGL